MKQTKHKKKKTNKSGSRWGHWLSHSENKQMVDPNPWRKKYPAFPLARQLFQLLVHQLQASIKETTGPPDIGWMIYTPQKNHKTKWKWIYLQTSIFIFIMFLIWGDHDKPFPSRLTRKCQLGTPCAKLRRRHVPKVLGSFSAPELLGWPQTANDGWNGLERAWVFNSVGSGAGDLRRICWIKGWRFPTFLKHEFESYLSINGSVVHWFFCGTTPHGCVWLCAQVQMSLYGAPGIPRASSTRRDI